MSVITGVFKTRAAAEQGVAELGSLGIDKDSINLLTPESTAAELAAVPRTDAEQPGISKGLGAVVGGMAGFAGGYGLAALALSGVGTVFAVGIAGGIVLGALGGAGGEAAGRSLDRAISQGLPTDEFFFYEDALKQGRSVVIVLTDPNLAEAARGALEKAGAETIDRARQKWWLGMRDVEKEHYDVGAAGGLQDPESWYRRGFEASLDPVNRGKSYQAGQLAHRTHYPDLYDEKAEAAFRRGYERGQAYLAAERSPQAAAKSV